LPRSVNPDLPEAVERVILKALAKNPDERYQTAGDLVAALDRAIAETPAVMGKPEKSPVSEATYVGVGPTLAAGVEEPEGMRVAPIKPKRRLPTWALGLTIGVVGLLAVGGIMLTSRANELPATKSAGEATSASAAQPMALVTPLGGGTGQIAFISDRGGNPGIYVMNTDGTGQRPLITDIDFNGDPSWSPDGRWITFSSDRDGNSEIYIMHNDGSSQTRLTSNLANDSAPAFSPDGRMIAFMSNRDGNFDIYVMAVDGTGQRRLTFGDQPDRDPFWSPDGHQIVFESRDYRNKIYIMAADGSNQQPLNCNGSFYHPTWSPDAQRIAFDNGTNITISGVDGCNGASPFSATGILINGTNPSWSPDSHWIAFTSNRDGNNEIYIMRSDGTGQMRLTSNTENERHPVWLP
jgi:dipeptidyl aminopeptidase/acylaminoacyl peptidase